MKLFVGTFNLAEQEIPLDDLRKWLIPCDCRYDLYSVGVQEGRKLCCFSPMQTSYRKHWEMNLLKVLGEKEFEILHAASFGVQHLAILIRKALRHFVSTIPVHFSVCVRFLSRKRRTKGAIVICMTFNNINLIFVSCHLRYGKSVKPRIEDFVKIQKEILKKKPFKTWLDAEDEYIFWSGDVNSRFDDLSLEQIRKALTLDGCVNLTYLLEHDQLYKNIKEQNGWFDGFVEADIHFQPTYKFCIKSVERDWSRNPGYADRVLYCSPEGKKDLFVRKYSCVPDVVASDHQPVYCIFEFEDLIPKCHHLTHYAQKRQQSYKTKSDSTAT